VKREVLQVMWISRSRDATQIAIEGSEVVEAKFREIHRRVNEELKNKNPPFFEGEF